MARGGYRPGAGRPKGTTHKPHRPKEDIAAERIARDEYRSGVANRRAMVVAMKLTEVIPVNTICVVCGNSFTYNDKSRGRKPKCCSIECRKIHAVKCSHDQYVVGNRSPRNMTKHKKHCAICDDIFTTDQNSIITCGVVCGNRLGHWSRSSNAVARRINEHGKIIPSYMRYWLRRRATIRDGEKINPIDVMERYGWKCYLCGGEAPKHLRGTTDDNAPELDHIKPLIKGGVHAMWNVACAHRSCNNEKGSLSLAEFYQGRF